MIQTIERDVDVAVIGAGPAGLAAATSAKLAGARKVIVLDRNDWLGGILPQCVHDGFGVEELGESLTGPEYAERQVLEAERNDVELLSGAMVLSLGSDRRLTALSKAGLHRISAKAVVLAMGCRERTRWSALIPGSRPSGIYTAGAAQAFVNLHNRTVGRRVVVLGSGNVGLIMARRMALEGAEVVAVVEALPHPTGLPRNVVQCLEDYGIPLLLRHTVSEVHGKARLEGATISEVDGSMRPIAGTERRLECDTLLLSLGLIPENELSGGAGIELDPLTGGPTVSQRLETSAPGIFACGNCLHVHDTVDMLSEEAAIAGARAAEFRPGTEARWPALRVSPGRDARYVVPQRIDAPGKAVISLRPSERLAPATLSITAGGEVLALRKLAFANPSTMVRLQLDVSEQIMKASKPLEVAIDGQR